MRYGLAVLAVFSLALLIVGNPARTSDPSLEPDAVPTMRDQASGETAAESTVRPLSADDRAAETTTDASATDIAIPDNARLALLIGNQEYSGQIRDLVRPHEDVRVLQTALEEVGFDVTIALDVDRAGTYARINAFADQLREAGAGVVGFVYYAGHGASIVVDEATGARSNFIIPAGTSVSSERELRQLGVPVIDLVDELNDALEGEPASSLFFITDACRTTIDGASSSDNEGQRGFVVSFENGGYSPLPPRAGLFMANSTLDGQTAPDDGAFADQLAYQITQPEQFAPRAFGLANRDVARIREYGEQLPTISDALTRDVCFVSCPGDANERVRELLGQQLIDYSERRVREAELESERGNARLALYLAYDGAARLTDPDGLAPLNSFRMPTGAASVTADTSLNAVESALRLSGLEAVLSDDERNIAVSTASENSELALTAFTDGSAIVWDARSGADLAHYSFDDCQGAPSGERLRCVVTAELSPNGERALITFRTESNTVGVLFDAISGAELNRHEHGECGTNSWSRSCIGGRFSPSGRYALTWGRDRIARVWDSTTGDLVSEHIHETSVGSAIFLRNELRILSWTISGDGPGRIWAVSDGAEIARLEIETRLPEIYRAQLASDGRTILTSHNWGAQVVWDGQTGVLLARYRAGCHESGCDVSTFSSDETRVVTSGLGRFARIWDAETGAELLRHDLGQGVWVQGSVFSPRGDQVLSWTSAGATVWDASAGAEVASVELEGGAAGASFNHTGERFLTFSRNGDVRLIDSSNGDEIGSRDHGQCSGYSLCTGAVFSNDGDLVLSWGRDGVAALWSAVDGQELSTQAHGECNAENSCASAIFLANGRSILSWGTRGARVWDAEWRPAGELHGEDLMRAAHARIGTITPPSLDACERYGLDCEAIRSLPQ